MARRSCRPAPRVNAYVAVRVDSSSTATTNREEFRRRSRHLRSRSCGLAGEVRGREPIVPGDPRRAETWMRCAPLSRCAVSVRSARRARRRRRRRSAAACSLSRGPVERERERVRAVHLDHAVASTVVLDIPPVRRSRAQIGPHVQPRSGGVAGPFHVHRTDRASPPSATPAEARPPPEAAEREPSHARGLVRIGRG